jgi:hypothetical protein
VPNHRACNQQTRGWSACADHNGIKTATSWSNVRNFRGHDGEKKP